MGGAIFHGFKSKLCYVLVVTKSLCVSAFPTCEMGILAVSINGYYSHVTVEEPEAEVLNHRLKVSGKARTRLKSSQLQS